MKARIKTNGKIVEVISRFMPRKRNAASRDWVCNLSDGTCVDESQLEYIEEHVEGLEEAAKKYAEKHGFRVPYDGSNNFYDDVDVKASKEAFIAGTQYAAPRWISVDEKLPEMDEEVIVLTDELGTAPIYKIAFGHIVDAERCIDYNGWNIPGVKYWMPCPEIPNSD